jgi:hypothetical protein
VTGQVVDVCGNLQGDLVIYAQPSEVIGCKGTFEVASFSAHIYNMTTWRFGRSRLEMNFPEVENHVEVEFLALELRVVSREQDKEDRQLGSSFGSTRPLARLQVEHSKLMHARLEFDHTKKKRAVESQARP